MYTICVCSYVVYCRDMTCSISGGRIANYGFLEQIKYNTIQYNTIW
jgi:hypothetical protein